MFSYIMLGTNDPQASYKFYAPLMRVLGHPLDGRSEKAPHGEHSKITILPDYALACRLIIYPPLAAMALW